MENLPLPESPELDSLLPTVLKRNIYRVLYENQGNPLSIAEIRQALGIETDEQGQFDRRVRELRHIFEVPCIANKYELTGRRKEEIVDDDIPAKLKTLVLSDGICAYCGKTPLRDGVRLHADHKIPRDWGGTNERDNLQPLCSECNENKKNLWADYDEYKDKVREITKYDEPHKRIGELLKAFDNEPIPDDLLEMVAKMGQYQKDWTRRLRELKELGWKYKVVKKKVGGRVRSSFILEHYEPWPEGSIRTEIKRREAQRKQTTESA